MLRIGRGLVLVTAIALGGCGTLEDVAGLPPTPERLWSNPEAAAIAETTYIKALAIRAGLDYVPGPQSGDWQLIQRAGIRDIDSRCDEYLDTLFRFNRQQRAMRQGLTATAATTGTILGIVKAAASTFGIVTAAFGLSASLFDAGTSSVLYTIEPSALRNVVLEGRDKYIREMYERPPNTRPDTMISLQGYLAQCTPAAIEANINLAANGSRNAVTSRTPGEATNAARLAGPGLALTRRDRSASEIDRPVDPNPPKQKPTDDHREPGEDGLDETTIRRVQVALGVTPDGRLGRPGVSQTRAAITEFEAGIAMRTRSGTAPTGRLAGRLRLFLPQLGPMPAFVRSPFERGLLTSAEDLSDALHRPTFDQIWPRLETPGAGAAIPAVEADMLRDFRKRVQDKRKEVAAKKPEKKIDPNATWLDVLFFDNL